MWLTQPISPGRLARGEVDHRHVAEIEPVAVEGEGRARADGQADDGGEEIAHRLLVADADVDVVEADHAPPPSVSSHASPQALASSRTRRM